MLSRARLEANGLGLRSETGRRGRVAVRRISSLSGDGQNIVLYEPGTAGVVAPRPTPAAARIAARAAAIDGDHLTLRFHSPMRLKAGGELMRRPQPTVLVHRILERWEGLRREYGPSGWSDPLALLRGPLPEGARGDPRALLAIADTITIAHDDTAWLDLASYSSRQHCFTPIGGFVGDATLAGNVAALAEALALGEVIRAGKDVVKGNGRYEMLPTSP